MEPKAVSFGAVIEATIGLFGRHWKVVLAVYLAFAAAMTAFEVAASQWFGAADSVALFTPDQLVAMAVSTLAGIPISYHLLRHIMVREGLCALGQERRYLSMLGATILSSMGIVIGLLFLIFPGFILMARWLLFGPFIVAQGSGPSDSLGRSWVATAKSQGGLATACFVLFLGLIALSGAVSFVSGEFSDVPVLPGLFWDTAGRIFLDQIMEQLYSASILLLSVTAYRLLVGSTRELDSVFA